MISMGLFALHQRLSFLTKSKVSKSGSCVPSGYPEPVEGAVVRRNTNSTCPYLQFISFKFLTRVLSTKKKIIAVGSDKT